MKKLIILIMCLLALTLVASISCGSSTESTAEEQGIILSSRDVGTVSVPAPGASPAYEPERDYSMTGGESEKKFSEGVSGTAVKVLAADDALDRMIVRTGDISLVVEDVTVAIDDIKRHADTYGGYVVSSSIWKNGEKLAGSITYRVLADRFDDALKALRNLAVEVSYENTYSRDVTEEYTDLDASLNNLEATEKQLLVIMDRAKTVEETLAVQKELTNIRGEIERTKARMQYLEQTSSTSLINVQLEQATMYFEFSADKRRGIKEGERIEFTISPVSGGFAPYSYLWDFGDGETSTDDNPAHSYKNDGYYTIELTVTDDQGNAETVTRENYVYVQPGWNAGSIAGKAWNGLVTFGHVLLNVLIWLGIFSPVWLVIGGLVIWRVRRRRSRKVS